MIDFAAARRAMIEGQVRPNDVTSRALVDAMASVPREAFAPKSKRGLVYGDVDVAVAEGRWLIRPRDFAKLAQAVDVGASDVVLDIACGRGYSTAVFAHMAEAAVGLESAPDLVAKATQTLGDLGADNAAVVEGDLRAGVPRQGPFNVIFVNGAVEEVPQSWLEQLAEGGRLGVVVRENAVGRARVFTRSGGVVGSRVVFDCASPVLPGFERPEAFVF